MPQTKPEINKNDFVHVDVYIKGMLRVMSEPEEMPMFNGYFQENRNLAEVLGKSKLPEEVLAFMEEMNSKLDQIIGLLEHNRMEAGFPIDIEVFNLSAAELLFASDARLSPGQVVEVVLPLTQMPLTIAGGIGKLEPFTHPQRGSAWKLSFTRIREEDMESIVQFAFQQERKRIREVRWD